ncbi:CLUMA_CG011689, isoform A [Clunio marinus]|uniref:CLUMA_CG011689, isoform A n=1 Tax=Clunio marinus TaxID=568069 RepID=A0A1J1IDG7_9DIPT|nr:CLUMA_CG011689, isoform A [Clunio marinus]
MKPSDIFYVVEKPIASNKAKAKLKLIKTPTIWRRKNLDNKKPCRLHSFSLSNFYPAWFSINTADFT